MKAFCVYFSTGFPVHTICEDVEEAMILAKADRISHNLPYKNIIRIIEEPYSEEPEEE